MRVKMDNDIISHIMTLVILSWLMYVIKKLKP